MPNPVLNRYFPLSTPGMRRICLGDFRLSHIAVAKRQYVAALGQIDPRDQDAIIALTREAFSFHRACEAVEPLLRQHPDWCWRDAIKFLSGANHVDDSPYLH